MADAYISGMTAAAALDGEELVEVSQVSSTVTITATTISAQASDNSYNDSANGFVTAGFANGDRVRVQGFTGNVANNILVGIITALTAGKMTIGGTDGDVIVNDTAGESVTISKWESHRSTTQDIADLGGGGGGGGIYDATWFDVTDPAYGALGDGSTDDTVAIQDAIDACEAAGGGTVYFPRGIYVVNGALQDTSRSNAQLLLPRRDYADTEAITIVLRGEAPPSACMSVLGATPLQNNLSVIKGTLNTGTGALIGAHGPVGTLGDFSNVYVVVQDLTVQMPSNPTLTALDLSRVAQLDIDNAVIHTGSFDVDGHSAQTTATSYGLRTPGNNDGALTRLGVVNVIGFYNGFEIGEHCFGQYVSAWACKQGFVFVATYHSSIFTRLMTVHCQKGLVFTGGEHNVLIHEFNIEHAASGTWVPTYDIDDGSNYARGLIYWHVVLAGTGIDATFLVNSAKYVKRARLQRLGSVMALTDGATVTIDCNQGDSFRWGIGGNRTFANPTNPYDGQVINVRIIQDGTGNRTWTLGGKFKFSGGAPTLSTAANAKDLVSCQYDATDDTWNCSIAKGMA